MTVHSLLSRLVSGDMDSTELQTFLGTSSNLLEFISLLDTIQYCRIAFEKSTSRNTIFGSALAKAELFSKEIPLFVIASSDVITEAIVADSLKAVNLFSNKTFYDAYRRNYKNYQRLKSFVNVSGSKLKRVEFLSSGTFTIPGTGLAALSIAGVGDGGNSYSGPLGDAGAGGEFATKKLLTGLPTSNVTVTVGGATSTFGSILTVTKGANGTSFGVGVGGGTTSGGGLPNVSDTDILNAALQFNDVTIKGADGAVANQKGKVVVLGTPAEIGQGGNGISSGGAGFLSGSAVVGSDGVGLGCGGGGSTSGNSNGSTGGFVAYYLENN